MKNRLKEVREDMKISQEELAEKSSVSRTTISNIENQEEIIVKSSTLILLANALNKKVSDIFFI